MQPLKNKEIIISNPDEHGEIIWPLLNHTV